MGIFLTIRISTYFWSACYGFRQNNLICSKIIKMREIEIRFSFVASCENSFKRKELFFHYSVIM